MLVYEAGGSFVPRGSALRGCPGGQQYPVAAGDQLTAGGWYFSDCGQFATEASRRVPQPPVRNVTPLANMGDNLLAPDGGST